MNDNHPDDHHVYFASGKGGEAGHIEKELLLKYEQAGKKQPKIVLEHKARFTVDNFLKTIPLITKERMNVCYLVTSDYHVPRSRAILNEFRELLTLIRDGEAAPRESGAQSSDHNGTETPSLKIKIKMEVVSADGRSLWTEDEDVTVDPHKVMKPRTQSEEEENADKAFLLEHVGQWCKDCNVIHETNVDVIRCPARDGSNSKKFADMIRRAHRCECTPETQNYIAARIELMKENSDVQPQRPIVGRSTHNILEVYAKNNGKSVDDVFDFFEMVAQFFHDSGLSCPRKDHIVIADMCAIL